MAIPIILILGLVVLLVYFIIKNNQPAKADAQAAENPVHQKYMQVEPRENRYSVLRAISGILKVFGVLLLLVAAYSFYKLIGDISEDNLRGIASFTTLAASLFLALISFLWSELVVVFVDISLSASGIHKLLANKESRGNTGGIQP